MGADNWTTCPRCAAKRDREVASRNSLAAASYGKVSAEQYAANLREAEVFAGKVLESSLREDYTVGIFNGEFTADYKARCTAPDCGFAHQHKHIASLKI